MNMYRRLLTPRTLFLINGRRDVHLVQDFKPGNIPKTAEEKAAAAAKYNLLPEEYEPYNDPIPGIGYGDYPKLPKVGVDGRDVYYPYDLPEDRRNFGEPLHQAAIFFHDAKTNPTYVPRQKPIYMFLGIVGFMLIFTPIFFDKTRFNPAVAARHLYGDGRKHYSYEFVD